MDCGTVSVRLWLAAYDRSYCSVPVKVVGNWIDRAVDWIGQLFSVRRWEANVIGCTRVYCSVSLEVQVNRTRSWLVRNLCEPWTASLIGWAWRSFVRQQLLFFVIFKHSKPLACLVAENFAHRQKLLATSMWKWNIEAIWLTALICFKYEKTAVDAR